jgi:DNA-directed RNA polymerase sigma subunit (sigma70/sigma32)
MVGGDFISKSLKKPRFRHKNIRTNSELFVNICNCFAPNLKHRSHIHALAGETGLEIQEFRKIVQMVQKGEREARQAKKGMAAAHLCLVNPDCEEITPTVA